MGKPQAFRKQGGGDEESFRAQSNVEAAFGNLSKSIILDGTLIEGLIINTTPTLIEHKLGRTYRGYFICKNTVLCTIRDSASIDDSKFITLQSSVATTISIWVF